jgi:hypothetical protein
MGWLEEDRRSTLDAPLIPLLSLAGKAYRCQVLLEPNARKREEPRKKLILRKGTAAKREERVLVMAETKERTKCWNKRYATRERDGGSSSRALCEERLKSEGEGEGEESVERRRRKGR